jgi:hypothetical protein
LYFSRYWTEYFDSSQMSIKSPVLHKVTHCTVFTATSVQYLTAPTFRFSTKRFMTHHIHCYLEWKTFSNCVAWSGVAKRHPRLTDLFLHHFAAWCKSKAYLDSKVLWARVLQKLTNQIITFSTLYLATLTKATGTNISWNLRYERLIEQVLWTLALWFLDFEKNYIWLLQNSKRFIALSRERELEGTECIKLLQLRIKYLSDYILYFVLMDFSVTSSLQLYTGKHQI